MVNVLQSAAFRYFDSRRSETLMATTQSSLFHKALPRMCTGFAGRRRHQQHNHQHKARAGSRRDRRPTTCEATAGIVKSEEKTTVRLVALSMLFPSQSQSNKKSKKEGCWIEIDHPQQRRMTEPTVFPESWPA
mmetsp:Transcript_23591/g.48981  ORF Transcript_23591/g.48981 Transcript_23591/m.48981 type:complete len:133 (-) Transcript_23591:716-1114(-)